MKPCRFEGEIQNLEVRGEIPQEIDGTFYRVMPDPQLPPFIENDPVSRPCSKAVIRRDLELAENVTTVVQWRRQHQRIPNQGWALPLQATLCEDRKVCKGEGSKEGTAGYVSSTG